MILFPTEDGRGLVSAHLHRGFGPERMGTVGSVFVVSYKRGGAVKAPMRAPY